MISRNVTIQNNVGLHARPATFFIQKANSFQSSLWVEETVVTAPCGWLWQDEEPADRDSAVRQNFVEV